MFNRRHVELSENLAKSIEKRFPRLADSPIAILLFLTLVLAGMWASPWVIFGYYSEEDIFTCILMTVMFYGMFIVGYFRRRERKRREASAADYAASVARVKLKRAKAKQNNTP